MRNILVAILRKFENNTALAAPVEDGIIFCAAPRPPRQSYTNSNRFKRNSLSLASFLLYLMAHLRSSVSLYTNELWSLTLRQYQISHE